MADPYPFGICTCHACNCELAVCDQCGVGRCSECGRLDRDCTCPPTPYAPTDSPDPWENL